jgi:hypothetical protein
MGVIASLCQAHRVQGKLVGLEGHFQPPGRAHPLPGPHLFSVQRAKPLAQLFHHVRRVILGWGYIGIMVVRDFPKHEVFRLSVFSPSQKPKMTGRQQHPCDLYSTLISANLQIHT